MAEQVSPPAEELYRLVRRLRVRVWRDVTTELAGTYASAFRGPGLEFHGLRRYEPGDEVRHIDWQVTARRREPYVRRYVEERELRVLIALDVSRSMDEGVPGATKRDRACAVAAAVALSAARNGDCVGGLLFGDQVLALIPPRRGEKHALSVLHRALAARATGGLTDLRPALRQVRNLRGHAVVFLLSDFITAPDPWDEEVRRLLAACARKHDVRAMRLAPADLPSGAIVEASESESARPIRLDMLGRAGAGARDALRAHGRLTAQALTACGVAVAEFGPTDSYLARLKELLEGPRSLRRRSS